MSKDDLNPAADWFARQFETPPDLTEGHRRCLRVLSSVAPLYNIATPCRITDAVSLWPLGGVSVITSEELATYDAAALTRLVVAAHRDQVRVAVKTWAPHLDMARAAIVVQWYRDQYEIETTVDELRALEITLHPRTANGGPSERHPSLGDLADEIAGVLDELA